MLFTLRLTDQIGFYANKPVGLVLKFETMYNLMIDIWCFTSAAYACVREQAQDRFELLLLDYEQNLAIQHRNLHIDTAICSRLSIFSLPLLIYVL